MADTEADQQEAAAQKDEDEDSDSEDGTTGQPEVEVPHDDRLEELKEQAKGIFDRYDKRDTVVLPGSDSTITGTAVNDFLDKDGEPVDHSEDSTDDESEDGDDKANPF